MRIADFGCARQMSGELYESSTISGSPQYMPPEQVGVDMFVCLYVYMCLCVRACVWEYLSVIGLYKSSTISGSPQ